MSYLIECKKCGNVMGNVRKIVSVQVNSDVEHISELPYWNEETNINYLASSCQCAKCGEFYRIFAKKNRLINLRLIKTKI